MGAAQTNMMMNPNFHQMSMANTSMSMVPPPTLANYGCNPMMMAPTNLNLPPAQYATATGAPGTIAPAGHQSNTNCHIPTNIDGAISGGANFNSGINAVTNNTVNNITNSNSTNSYTVAELTVP